MVKKVLTINHSNSKATTGIQKDIQVFQQNGVFGFTTIVSIHTQYETFKVSNQVIEEQLESVFQDGPMDAIKVTEDLNEAGINSLNTFLKAYPEQSVILETSLECLLLFTETLHQIQGIVITTPNIKLSLDEAKELLAKLSSTNQVDFFIPYFEEEYYYLTIKDHDFSSIKAETTNSFSAYLTSQYAKNKRQAKD